jgi:hypothetical protein
MILDVLINGETFRTFVEKMLVLTLKPGDIVTMDNLVVSNRCAAMSKCGGLRCATCRETPPHRSYAMAPASTVSTVPVILRALSSIR